MKEHLITIDYLEKCEWPVTQMDTILKKVYFKKLRKAPESSGKLREAPGLTENTKQTIERIENCEISKYFTYRITILHKIHPKMNFFYE